MKYKECKNSKGASVPTLSLKCAALVLLLALSVLIVACGANPNASMGNDTPAPTVTFTFNGQQTPVPKAAEYNCATWITNNTIGYNRGGNIAVNMKFTHLVNGVPKGMAGATAAATITWAGGGGSYPLQTKYTTSDGLAVTYFSIIPNPVLNQNNQVTVVFTSADGKVTCKADGTQAAYFTIVQPTAKPVPTRRPRG